MVVVIETYVKYPRVRTRIRVTDIYECFGFEFYMRLNTRQYCTLRITYVLAVLYMYCTTVRIRHPRPVQ
jgi:hypothetical protein